MSLRSKFISAFCFGLTVVCSGSPGLAETYPIVDTGQERCYDTSREIKYPKAGEPFFGQDAQYQGNQPAYRDNGDGTISDLVTGLMWQKDPGPKKTFEEAVAGASACRVGRYDDWRLPSIKELYSLIVFSGEDIDPRSTDPSNGKPFIDTDYFKFAYGERKKGERVIDSQMASSTKYVSTTMRGNQTMFGVNFADGRIKGYPAGPMRPGRPTKGYYVFYVRGNTEYGKNHFRDNGDGTITDRATGLTWAKVDSAHLRAGEKRDGKLNWQQALRWVEELEYAGFSDWRLPNVKELQSIVDYTRSPDTTQSAAIDPIFSVTPIRDALGEVNYPFYWSSTTHKRMGGGAAAAYVAFGRSQGWMPSFGGQYDLLDVHGAGSQRSDPKAGDPSQFPRGRGPQGDVIRIYNMVRPVRGGKASFRRSGPELQPQPSGRRGRGPGQRGPMGPGGMGPGQQRPGGMGSVDPMGGDRPGFVSRLDRDGDGKVSREEFDGPAEAFGHLDANRDGYLNDSEGPAQQGMGPQQGQRPGRGSRPHPGRASFAGRPLPFEDSPFGFHPATVPPDVGRGDRWSCAREIGVRWHRPVVYAFWFLCQPTYKDCEDGIFRWRRLDESLGKVPQGINVLGNLSARNYTLERSWLPRDVEGYRKYVRAVVERYDGDGTDDAPGSPVVRYWQVENEPNLPPWGGTPEQYAKLLRHTYQAAKQANPLCKIVIGGVGGWTGSGRGSSLEGFRRFFLPVIKRLGGTGFDIFDYHWYGNASGDYRGYGEVHREVRATLDKHAFQHVPIWITEMGSYCGKPRTNPPQSEAQQAADLVRRHVYPLSLGVEKVFWAFGLLEGFKHDDGYFDHTGLIYDGHESSDRGRGVRKLAYFTYKLMTEKLEGKRFVLEVPGLPDNVYAYRFGKGTDTVMAIWWDWWNEPDATEKIFTLPVKTDCRVTSAITGRDAAHRSWPARSKGGGIVLTLGKEPCFIEPAHPNNR